MENKSSKQEEEKDVYQMLTLVQNELKAPKKQRNSFGNYNYRNCEDIQEAVKPLLLKYECSLFLDDEVVLIGSRYYVKSFAHFIYKGNCIEVNGFAREEEIKKGMDGSQITGSSSSYARKYALNALFLIDDTKDSDSTNTHGREEPKKATVTIPKITALTNENIVHAINENLAEKVLSLIGTKYSATEEQKQMLIDSVQI
jgi:hypothetical protein